MHNFSWKKSTLEHVNYIKASSTRANVQLRTRQICQPIFRTGMILLTFQLVLFCFLISPIYTDQIAWSFLSCMNAKIGWDDLFLSAERKMRGLIYKAEVK